MSEVGAVFVGSAAAGTPYLVGDQSRGTGVVQSFSLSAEGQLSANVLAPTGVAVGSNPTAIIAHPGGLLVSDETYGDEGNSRVWSAQLADGGTVAAGNSVDAGGRACCHLALHPNSSLVAAANYLGEAPAIDPANKGTLSIFRVGADGLGERTAHITHVSPLPPHTPPLFIPTQPRACDPANPLAAA